MTAEEEAGEREKLPTHEVIRMRFEYFKHMSMITWGFALLSISRIDSCSARAINPTNVRLMFICWALAFLTCILQMVGLARNPVVPTNKLNEWGPSVAVVLFLTGGVSMLVELVLPSN